ncbi:hypothetical protein ACB098_05G049300 [Castanea mollissima]
MQLYNSLQPSRQNAGTPKPKSFRHRRHPHGSLPLHQFLFASPSSLNLAHHILCRQIILRFLRKSLTRQHNSSFGSRDSISYTLLDATVNILKSNWQSRI